MNVKRAGDQLLYRVALGAVLAVAGALTFSFDVLSLARVPARVLMCFSACEQPVTTVQHGLSYSEGLVSNAGLAAFVAVLFFPSFVVRPRTRACTQARRQFAHMARNTLQSVGTLTCEKQPGSILLTAARPIVFPVPCAPSGIAHQLDAGDPAREQAVGGCADFVCSRLSESTQARTMRRCQNHATHVVWAESGSSKATRSVIE